jgi:transposase
LLCDGDVVEAVFSGLSPLVIESLVREGEVVRVRARTPGGPAACPGCGALTERVHGYHQRQLADLPVDGRPVAVELRVRRLVCPTLRCVYQTFREQVPGVTERYQRRTPRLAKVIGLMGVAVAGRLGARLLSLFAVAISATTVLRLVMARPVAEERARAVCVDDFALRRRKRYATLILNADTHARLDVLPDRTADTLEAWLRAHPGIDIVCRDGSPSCTEAIRRALPDATQVSDRWHLWHGLTQAAEKAVVAHSGCWAKAGPQRREMTRERTTLQRGTPSTPCSTTGSGCWTAPAAWAWP